MGHLELERTGGAVLGAGNVLDGPGCLGRGSGLRSDCKLLGTRRTEGVPVPYEGRGVSVLPFGRFFSCNRRSDSLLEFLSSEEP